MDMLSVHKHIICVSLSDSAAGTLIVLGCVQQSKTMPVVFL